MTQSKNLINGIMTGLRKLGYDCTLNDKNEIAVSKDGFSILDVLEIDRFRLYKNTVYDPDCDAVVKLCNTLKEAYELFNEGNQLQYQGVGNYRLLNEYAGYVLAARVNKYDSMEFVTWRIDNDRMGVSLGHYHDDYKKAKEDFAIRTGMIDYLKLFDETEMKLIRQGLIHLGADAPHITTDENQMIGSIVKRIESIIPSIQEHEKYEREEIVPDDELSL